MTSSPRGVGEQRGKKNSGAFALSPLLAPHFFLPSRIAPRLGRRKKKVFCLSLKKRQQCRTSAPRTTGRRSGTSSWTSSRRRRVAEQGQERRRRLLHRRRKAAAAAAAPAMMAPPLLPRSRHFPGESAPASSSSWAWAPPLAAGARRSTPSPSPACERRRCCSTTGAWASRAALARRSRTRRRPWPGTSWSAW